MIMLDIVKYRFVHCFFYTARGYARNKCDGCLSSEKLGKILEEGTSAN